MKKIYSSMMAIAIAAFTFTACEDVPEPYNNPYDSLKPDEPEVVIEPAGEGTATDPYNIAKALQVCQEVGETGTTEDVYAKGIITSISDIDTGQYGNATFMISDDSKGTNTITVYRAYPGKDKKFTSDTEIAVGDTVVIVGKLVNYKSNTPEFTQGCYIYSLKKGEGGSTEQPDAPGTLEAPLTVAQALAYIDNLGADKQSPVGYVKGKIVAVSEISTSYGNATYTISDDGTEANTLQIYRGLGLGGEKFTSEDAIKAGDIVVVSGKLVNFKGNTKQFAQGSKIVELNGQKADNGGDTPSGEATGNGTENSPFNVAAAVAKCVETGETATNDIFFVKGIVDAEYTVDSYKNATIVLVDAEGASQKFTAYRVKGADGKSLKEGYKIPKGATVIVSGKLVNFKGNTPETAQNSGTLISVNGQAPELDGESGEGGEGGEGGGSGDVVTTLTNGDFETWAEGLPTGWKSASSASSATLEQSTDAHGGSYSVNVKGNESSNKRLASQEITLEAGTYTFSFWAKATVSDASQARPGFVPVVDGTAVSSSYTYGDYATLSTDWQQVSYEFTLTAETTVCLLVMNPKKSSYSSGKDILIDDATLTKK
ncbi:carbohydrate binding domain-containing protein [Prevotella sp. E2-28]|uniref:carbohydrate binding domain-containing protein n=1 Tax=Prevotella sp. E2-28 TaxID=2913620 RepID=UPI001EDC1455|nr:carbohydrate binding domain-containing protein [Prevotella sp. E2-28]UKK52991.1 carbohydrate binding domain-containing protein [Prevotella sp. E2-28]